MHYAVAWPWSLSLYTCILLSQAFAFVESRQITSYVPLLSICFLFFKFFTLQGPLGRNLLLSKENNIGKEVGRRVAHNHTGFQWQREAAGSGMGSLKASPHWSRKFGKLHGNLISAAALCSLTEPRPGAGRHMCDSLPTDACPPVSEADRGTSFLVVSLWAREGTVTPRAVLLQPIKTLYVLRGNNMWGWSSLVSFPLLSQSLFPSLQRPCSAAPARLQSSLS